MQKLTAVLLFLIFPFLGMAYEAKTIDFSGISLEAPMEIPLILAGNFGEMRSNHFHTGLDIKTKGVEGQKVFAIEEGYISRIRVSPWGYGNAIYIDHPNGLTSLYAHLKGFNKAIDSLVYAYQKKNEAYTTDEVVLQDSLYVKRGELIGLSGNSGSSFAPHLHFEIRETSTEHALNPLLFACYQKKITDNRPPRLTGVKFYAITETGYLIPGKSVYYPCSQSGGKWVINNNKPIALDAIITESSVLGIGFHTTDQLDAASNICGVHHTTLKKDGEVQHEQQIDYIDFANNRFLNSHQDYFAFKQNKRNIHKHFTTVVNPLNIYKKNNGKIPWESVNGAYNFESVDAHGNAITLQFRIETETSKKAENPFSKAGAYLFPDSVNTVIKDSFQLLIEPGSFYEPLQRIYRVSPPQKSYHRSAVYQFGEYAVPVQKHFDVRIQARQLAAHVPLDKLGIGVISDRGYLSFLGGDYVDGWVEARSRSFGQYVMVVDTAAPKIKPLDFNENKTITKYNTLELSINDNLSGVRTYKAFINDQWVLMIYHRRKKRYIIPLDARSRPHLKKGENNVTIIATDRKNNTSSLTHTVIY